MTENTAEEPQESAEAVDAAETTETTDEGSASREAARYRRKLRETEAERDTLTGRLEAMQRAEAERVAGEHLDKAEALWASGAELADLLDEDGNVSAEKVATVAAELVERLGVREVPNGPTIPNQGRVPDVPATDVGFSRAFAPR